MFNASVVSLNVLSTNDQRRLTELGQLHRGNAMTKRMLENDNKFFNVVN